MAKSKGANKGSMKILLSAYACEPGKGSEPGVGWNWACEIAARGHQVWVLTRRNNKSIIEQTNYDKERIHFVFYDPTIFISLKKIIGVHLYYMIWQMGAAFVARKYHREVKFDVAHHITFGVFRNISYIPFLVKSPFVFGPVGGGETAPMKLRKNFDLLSFSKDLFRDVLNWCAYISPLYRYFLSRTYIILSKSEDTLKFIPASYRNKARVSTEIGVHGVFSGDETVSKNEHRPVVLFVGRFIYWKAPVLVLRVIQQLQHRMPEISLKMIGKGPEKNNLEKCEIKMGLKNVEWIDWITQKELNEHYKTSSVFLYPSLHDSSGNVVLEALAAGLPVVCLDLGGPPMIVGDKMDTVIKTENLSEEQIVAKLSNKIYEILTDVDYRKKLEKHSVEKAGEFIWSNSVAKVYQEIEKDITKR